MAPSAQGREAAKAGLPHTACPFPKPDRPVTMGEEYPGPWADWMSGWLWMRAATGHDDAEARAERHDFIASGLRRGAT